MKKLLLALAMAFTAFAFYVVPAFDINDLIEKLDTWNEVFPEEKIYIHTDKPFYSFGDTLWYKVYMVNGQSLMPDTLSSIVYLDLIDANNEVVAQRNHLIYFGGSAGEIPLPVDEWQAGQYQLRAYTRFMANQEMAYQYQKEFMVLDQALVESESEEAQTVDDLYDRLDVQFLPESGYMVEGLKSVIGIKAIDQKTGMGLDVSGEIKNRQGDVVAEFKTFYRGLGQFSFTPKKGDRYRAFVQFKDQIRQVDLPEIESRGHILSVRNRAKEILVSTSTNISSGLEGSSVVCQMNGQIVAHSDYSGNANPHTFALEKSQFNTGVMQLTLFNSEMRPLAERLIFVEGAESSVESDLRLNQDQFTPREKVTMDIKIVDSDYEKNPQTNLSVAVTDMSIIPRLPGLENIKTNLLLTSELRGKIESPGYYFVDDDPKRKRLLDILMMTQGWRRFEWKDVLTRRKPRRKHPMERGFTLDGRIVNKKKADDSKITYVTLNTLNYPYYTEEIKAKKSGSFRFSDLPFIDTAKYVVQASMVSKKKMSSEGATENQKRRVSLKPFEHEMIQRDTNYISPLQNVDDMIAFVTETERKNEIHEQYGMVIELDEVVVTRNKVEEEEDPYDRDSQTYDEPDNRLIIDSIIGAESYNSVFQLIRTRVPGIEVYGTYPNETAVIRGLSTILGSNEAMYLIDGIPVDAQALTSLQMFQISHIDVIRGARAAILGGGQSGNGAILVYTKTAEGPATNDELDGMEYVMHPGIYPAKTFYSPRYDDTDLVKIGVDLRTTLYWEPFVVTDSLGNATIEFYTCDKSADYNVDVQGVTFTGDPIVLNTTIKVREQ